MVDISDMLGAMGGATSGEKGGTKKQAPPKRRPVHCYYDPKEQKYKFLDRFTPVTTKFGTAHSYSDRQNDELSKNFGIFYNKVIQTNDPNKPSYLEKARDYLLSNDDFGTALAPVAVMLEILRILIRLLTLPLIIRGELDDGVVKKITQDESKASYTTKEIDKGYGFDQFRDNVNDGNGIQDLDSRPR